MGLKQINPFRDLADSEGSPSFTNLYLILSDFCCGNAVVNSCYVYGIPEGIDGWFSIHGSHAALRLSLALEMA
jgi:hypothetical protein